MASLRLALATTLVPRRPPGLRQAEAQGQQVREVTRTDFFLGKTKVKTDEKAPFTQVLTTVNPKKGATYTVKARAFIKVKRGKSPKKSITSSLRVCA